MKGKLFFFLAVLYLCTAGCYKFERSGNMEKPGIALTFDDASIDNWCKYLPLLDSFGAKATFYISGYHLLTYRQREKLKEIQRHGHEIGYHTTFHSNLCEYHNQHGIKELLEIEICQDLKKMNRDGFCPTTFAYPYGVHDGYLDGQLLKIFKSLRLLNGSNNLSKSLTSTTSNTLLYGLGMDNDRRSNEMLEKMIDLAAKNHNCLVLIGHQIESPDAKFQVPYQKLKFILQKAKDRNMVFYRAAEISN